jgi:signal transduction histidine kinase
MLQLETSESAGQVARKLNCLYAISCLVNAPRVSLEEILRRTVELIPSAWRYPEIICARIIVGGREYKNRNFGKAVSMQACNIFAGQRCCGRLEVGYLRERPQIDEGPFSKEEKILINTVAEQLGGIIERKQAEQEILADQEQIRSLSAELVSVEEQERRRIAMALHDSLAQLLAFSRIELGKLQKYNLPGGLTETVGRIRELIDRSIEQTRTLIFDISPPELYTLGLDAAIEELARRISEEGRFKCCFKNCCRPLSITEDMKVLLYRSVRELLVNVAKHSRAKVVNVTLCRTGNDIQIAIEDDGVGFDIADVNNGTRKRGCLGLLSIRQRLTNIGGRFDIRSDVGKGTKITLLAPLEPGKGE